MTRFRRTSKIVADQFIYDICSMPDVFKLGEHILSDTRHERDWWIASGQSHFGLYRPVVYKSSDLTWWDRRRCWKAFDRWRSRNMTIILKGGLPK